MRLNRLLAVSTLAVAVISAPSMAAESTTTCAPTGTTLTIAAKEKAFDKDCLAAPAGETFSIAFDNQDVAVPHNVSIYDTANGNQQLFKGEVIFGPDQITYTVPAQAAGTYEFRCDPHDDTMIGTFIVQ
ncbi:MAG TPA: cupredoxin domain-containing protein [Acidimicrobiia bacterium]|nr:cupredoxin domain-containing protein [Acidimicrobiia bacterium]